MHPEISGNKFRKLRYNILEAQRQGKDKLLTFGGAFSNHIAAAAAAGKEFGIRTVGVIRGEELGQDLEKTVNENPTLRQAVEHGMELEFLSRDDYRNKTSPEILEKLSLRHGNPYLLPEGWILS